MTQIAKLRKTLAITAILYCPKRDLNLRLDVSILVQIGYFVSTNSLDQNFVVLLVFIAFVFNDPKDLSKPEKGGILQFKLNNQTWSDKCTDSGQSSEKINVGSVWAGVGEVVKYYR